MLGAHLVAMKIERFLLGHGHDLARSIGESV